MGSVLYRNKLVEYIKKNLKKGYPLDTLKVALVNQGYSRPIIEEAIKEAMDEMAKEAPTLKEKPAIEPENVPEESEPMVVEKKSFFKKLFNFKK